MERILQEGKYGDIKFISSDSLRYRHFILRGFPCDEEIDLLYANIGELKIHVHKFSRILVRGRLTTSVRLIWKSHEENPPTELALYPDMEEDSPNITLEEVEPRPLVCYNCKEKGHVKRRCPMQRNQEYNPKDSVHQDRMTENKWISEDGQAVQRGNAWQNESMKTAQSDTSISIENINDHQQGKFSLIHNYTTITVQCHA